MEKPIKISIVDDHSLFRKGLTSLIEEFDEVEIVSQASNGKEFTDSLKTEIPDLVLLDIEMPEMNGEETTMFLYKHFPKIKILIITMHDDGELARHLMMRGAHGFLPKDSDIETVVEAVRSVMKTGYYFNEYFSREVLEELMLNGVINPKFKSPKLTAREIEVLVLICKELTCKEIGEQLFLSKRTVEEHRKKLLKKTGARSIVGLTMFAIQHNIHKWPVKKQNGLFTLVLILQIKN